MLKTDKNVSPDSSLTSRVHLDVLKAAFLFHDLKYPFSVDLFRPVLDLLLVNFFIGIANLLHRDDPVEHFG